MIMRWKVFYLLDHLRYLSSVHALPCVQTPECGVGINTHLGFDNSTTGHKTVNRLLFDTNNFDSARKGV